jgi:hypothetical protein
MYMLVVHNFGVFTEHHYTLDSRPTELLRDTIVEIAITYAVDFGTAVGVFGPISACNRLSGLPITLVSLL